MRNLLCLFFLFIVLPPLYAQSDVGAQRLRILFYNVENFFDCLDDPDTDDAEFLPESMRHWHVGRFRKKAGQLARVLCLAGAGEPPLLVGMAEVESAVCLTELTRYSPLKQFSYEFLHVESPDARGIDVALLYLRYRFEPLQSYAIPVDRGDGRNSRDFLYVRGRVDGRTEIQVLVVHFPSKYGGAARSRPARRAVCRRLIGVVDSLSTNGLPLLVMGDFNETPLDADLKQIPLHPAMLELQLEVDKGKRETGSYKYQGLWSFIDQFLFNESMHARVAGVGVYAADYLLEPDVTHMGRKPFRTYVGMRYHGGYSDHLPIFADVFF